MRTLSEEKFAELLEKCEFLRDEPLAKLEGYDDCCFGLCVIPNSKDRLLYSTKAIIEKLMSNSLTKKEAIYYFLETIFHDAMFNDGPCFME